MHRALVNTACSSVLGWAKPQEPAGGNAKCFPVTSSKIYTLILEKKRNKLYLCNLLRITRMLSPLHEMCYRAASHDGLVSHTAGQEDLEPTIGNDPQGQPSSCSVSIAS